METYVIGRRNVQLQEQSPKKFCAEIFQSELMTTVLRLRARPRVFHLKLFLQFFNGPLDWGAKMFYKTTVKISGQKNKN